MTGRDRNMKKSIIQVNMIWYSEILLKQSLQRLHRLQRLQRIQRIQRLQRKQRI